MQDKQLVTYITRHEGVGSAELARHLGVKKRAMRDRLHRANAALGGCETLTSLDEMAETVLRVGLKLKEHGINDLGVCYCKVQRELDAKCGPACTCKGTDPQ